MSSSSTIHETVQRLNAELENADLLVLKSKPKFLSKKTHDDQEWPTSNDAPDALSPAGLAANVELQKVSGILCFWCYMHPQTPPPHCSEVPTEPQVQVPRTSRKEEVCR